MSHPNEPQQQQHQQQVRNKVQLSLIAGSSSGIVSTILLYPMDVIRIKMQTTTGECGKGPLQVIYHTYTHGGIRAFYTGMALPLAAQAVYKGTVFFINDVTQNYIRDIREYYHHHSHQHNHQSTNQIQSHPHNTSSSSSSSSLTLFDRFICGFMGGAVNGALFVTPVELVRNQLIAQHTKLATSTTVTPTSSTTTKLFHGSWDVIQQTIYHSHRPLGILSLWRGIGWTITRDGFGCGAFFYTIAYCQQILTPIEDVSPSLTVKVISGGIAGLAYWVVALPLDSIKTWIQSSTLHAPIISVPSVLYTIYNNTGIRGIIHSLLRGWQVAYGKGIPSSALIVVSYSIVYDGLLKVI